MASFHLTSRLSFLSPTQSTSVSVRFGQFNNFADCAAYAFTNVSMLALLSEPAVHGDHILLQWPSVCSSGTSASVGLRPHCHTTACNHYQPRWAKTQCKSIKLDRLFAVLTDIFDLAVMMEFPMVWQWWLALGRNTHCQITLLHKWRT